MESAAVGAATQPVAHSLFEALKEQLKYVVRYRAYIEDLDRALNDLNDIRVAVLHQIIAASRNAENIENEVKSWSDQVEKIIVEAKEVLEDHKNSKKGCFCSIVPNPSTRYSIAKQAGDKKKDIDELRRRRIEFGRISYPSDPPGIVRGTYAARGSQLIIPKSRVSILEDINKALLDSNVRIVGIWGASGVGKSTLLKEVEKQIHEKKSNYDFDEVAIAAVTGSPNPERIQDDLAYGLGLKLNEEKSIDQKAHRLWKRLNQKQKVLIILDDIWRKIDLQKLGIPFDDNHPGVKLLLTSRTEKVLVSEMNSEQNFHLDRLEDLEAVDLFKQLVGDRPQDEALLIDQLAKECAGLPVLIFPLAAALRYRPSSKWDEALSKLRQANDLRMEEFIQKSLEFNYHLIEGEDIKSLFLMCGQIGDQIIAVDDLLIYGMGLGLQEGVLTIEEARGKYKALLNSLMDSCLLEKYYREGFVKLHDRIGDTALSVASKTHPSLVIRNSKKLAAYCDDDLRRCRYITLYLDDKMHKLLERLTCPMLQMLLIYSEASQPTHLEIPDAFFKDLRELKVLDLSDLIVTSLPSSIQFLTKLQTLCLDGVTIEDIAMIGKLKTLRCLTFRDSQISRIPKEIGDLSNLRLLNLDSCSNLEVIEPDVLGRLIYLEELTLPLDFAKWDAKGINHASLIELSNMSHLSNLTIWVPNAVSFPSNMALQGLVEFNIKIGNFWVWKCQVEARTLRIELDSCSSKLIYKEWLQIILKKTQELDLHGWIGIEETFTNLSKEGFPQLKHIQVESCPSIKYIIHSNQPDPFPVLESLSLFGLIKLQKICTDNVPHICLGKLKVIKVESCDELRNLFSSSLARDLPLEEIEVSDCTMIEEVIVDEGEKVELRHLRKLKLVNLRNILCFCSNANQRNIEDDGNNLFEFLDGGRVSLPCLESLILRELPKLKKISDGQHPVNLHNLKSLELLKCNSLTYALDSNLLQQLENLESLEIEDCESMETIFQLNTYEATPNQSLQINLELRNLPNLKKIWNGNRQIVSFVLQRINKLEVSKCDKLENLFSTSMARSLGNISHISIASCKTIKEIFEEENGDPEIEFLSLSHLSISNMENLTAFSHGNHRYRFPCLMQLIISQCPRMTTFVSCRDAAFFNQKVNLPRLDKLVLDSLKSLTSIWGNNLSEDSFCKLVSIEIANCASVSTLFHSHLVGKLQNLTKVRLLDLPQLRQVVEKALTFPSLREITVEGCHSLTYLLPHAVARSLSELANINISSCKDLLEVVSFSGIEDDMASSTKAMRFDNLSSLQLENLEGLVYFCPRDHDLYFPILKKLSIIGCKNLKAFVRGSSYWDRSELRLLEASSSSNLEVDFSPLFDEKVVFPNLEELQMKGLEVKEIWPKKEPVNFHMELKNLEVEECHQLSTIFPPYTLHNLHSLECLSVKSCNLVKVIFKLAKDGSRRQKILNHLRELRVSSCVSIQHIVAIQHVVAMRDDDYIGGAYYRTFIFPQLSSLTLSELPELGSFCHENHKIELLSIEALEIEGCQSVKVLIADSHQDCKPLLLVEKMEFPKMVSMVISKMQNLTKLWHISEESTHSECSLEAFYKLKQLKVEECGSLKTVVPAKMIRAFHNLEELIVVDSELLESVFESTGSRSETESNNFNHVVSSTFALRNLELKGLPRMNHVWKVEDPKWASLSFEKLRSIRINDCRSLIHLFPASLARTLHQLYRLQIRDCQGMKEIVWSKESAHQQSLSTPPESNISLGMHSLKWPSLERMAITKCPNAKILPSSLQKNKDAVTNIDSLPKVDIPRLQIMFTDASILENRQFIDEIYGNPTALALVNVENQAWVQSVPWSLLLERFPNLQDLVIAESDSKEIFPSRNENVGAIVSYKPGILIMVRHLEICHCHHLTFLSPSLALFNNLTSLVVAKCNGIRYLVTSSVASGLLQLTELKIFYCNNLEEIVKCDSNENGDRAKHDDYMISFPQLKKLLLRDLPVIQSFSSTSCKFNFPSLRYVYMRKLPKMHVFCEGELITPYKHRIKRNIRALYNQEVASWRICPGS